MAGEANPVRPLRVDGEGTAAALAAAGGFVAQELKVANVQLQLAANGFKLCQDRFDRDPNFSPGIRALSRSARFGQLLCWQERVERIGQLLRWTRICDGRWSHLQ